MSDDDPTVNANQRPSDTHFCLGDWLVQPDLCRLERGESSQRLRPQLMDLLVCLAAHSGKTVSREELFARVWPGQYVVETALARCIAELRQVLEDDAHAPRVIETIPKRGYRLLMPVTAAPPPAPQAPEAAAPAIERRAERERPAGERLLRRRSVRWALAVALLCLPFAARAVWTYSARPALAERSGVVVAFTNATGENVFDGTLGLALAIQLEQSPYLRPISAERVAEALRVAGHSNTVPPTPAAARDACRRLGGQVLLTGSISTLGRRYVIGLEAITCGTADVLAREQTEVEGRENVLGAVGRVAADVRRSLGESLSSMARHDVIPSATPAALAALKAISLGDAARGQGRDLEAVRRYEEALAADPGSALAHVRLGVVLGEAGRQRESAEHIAKAYGLRDRVGEPERFYIDAHYQARVQGNVDKAVSLFEEWRRSYPGSDLPAIDLARLYAMLGRYEDAVQASRDALRLDPGYVPMLDLLGNAQVALGRFDEAAAAADARVARGTDTPALHRQLFEMAFVTSSPERMAREVAWAESHPEALPLLREAQADAAAFGGRRREATTRWEAIVASMRASGDVAAIAHHFLGQAYAEALWGDAQRARTLVASAVAEQRVPPVILGGARILAVAHDLASANRLVDECGRACGPDWSSLPQELRAALALAGRDAKAALALLRPSGAAELGLGSHFTTLWLRAEALRQAGQTVEAATEYRRIVDHRGLFASSVLYPAAHLGLARTLAASRDWDAAGQAYRRLLAIWKDADSDLPALRAARAELAALPTK